MSLWYDEQTQRIKPVADDLKSAYCDKCRAKQQVIRKLNAIVCGYCRTVLYSR